MFAFQFQNIAKETFARELGLRLSNFSVYARDAALVNGTEGKWRVPSELPSKDWAPIRASYWAAPTDGAPFEFTLGAIEPLARFFSASRSAQAFAIPSLPSAPPAVPTPTAAVATPLP